MKIDLRTIATGTAVIILAIAAWLLIAPGLDSNANPATTSRGVNTTSLASTSTDPAIPERTTTVIPPSTRAPTTVPEGGITTTTTATPRTTTTVKPTTVPATTPLQEPDLALCRDNDLPDRQCRWVGVDYPDIAADPREQPHEFLRQYTAFLDWSTANLERGSDLLFIAADGDNHETLMDKARTRAEQNLTILGRASIEGPIEVLDASEDSVEVTATVIDGRSEVFINGELDETYESQPPAPWTFTIEFTEKFGEERWRVTHMESIE